MRVPSLRANMVSDANKEAAMPDYYEIIISGHLDKWWSDWFTGLKLTHLEGGETQLSGPLPDQAALHGLLERIRDLNLTLISVTCGGPSTPDSAKAGRGVER